MDSKKIQKYYDAIGCGLSAIIALIIICISMRVWNMDFTVFPSLTGDPLLYMYSMKSMDENGIMGYVFNQWTGAPGNAHLADIILNDFDTAIGAGFWEIVTGNISTAFHITYIMTFPLAAVFMYLALRKIEIRGWISVLFAQIFAFTPYHFIRGEEHLVLCNIGAISAGILLAFCILNRDMERTSRMQNIVYVLIAIYVGFSFGYYPPFIIVIMGIAVVYRLINDNSIQVLKKEAVYLYITVAAFLTGYAPKTINAIINGPNLSAAMRSPAESEYYGLKIIQMLFPAEYTRSEFLQKVLRQYTKTEVVLNENTSAALGTIAALFFLGLCFWFIYSFISKRKVSYELDYISMSVLSLILIGTVGGFGTVVSYVLTPQIRGWNRISIVIAGLVVCAGAIFIEKFVTRINKKIVSILLCTLLSGIMLYDQVPVFSADWQYSLKEEQEIYEAFFDEIENELEYGDMVYQLPYQEFYESGYTNTILPYLFTEGIHWSSGGGKGRDFEGKDLYIEDGMGEVFLNSVISAGFSGILVNTGHYEDNGEAVIRFYSEEMGLTPIVSSNGRYYFYDITKYD